MRDHEGVSVFNELSVKGVRVGLAQPSALQSRYVV